MAVQVEAIEALGAIECTANTPVTTASILSIPLFSTATIVKIKTQNSMLSIDGTVKFATTFDAISNLQSGHTYIFDKDTTLMVGKYVVTP